MKRPYCWYDDAGENITELFLFVNRLIDAVEELQEKVERLERTENNLGIRKGS